MSSYKDFGCIAWQDRRRGNLPNYPSKTPEQLRIEDLERENDAALEKIVALSNALCSLGYDPTQLHGEEPSEIDEARPAYRIEMGGDSEIDPSISLWNAPGTFRIQMIPPPD
jgi:hypothetical protein